MPAGYLVQRRRPLNDIVGGHLLDIEDVEMTSRATNSASRKNLLAEWTAVSDLRCTTGRDLGVVESNDQSALSSSLTQPLTLVSGHPT